MLDTFFATKSAQTQAWTKTGIRLPVVKAKFTPMLITQIKSTELDGYQAIQVGFGAKKISHVSRQLQGHLKKSATNAGKDNQTPRFLREIRVDSTENLSVGKQIEPAEVLELGDVVNVTSKSHGRGFTGVVKRWGFHGGPKTHGQSDRERAPGSIGQGTTPGRIFKGKKMAGHHGNSQVTVRNLTVLAIDATNQEIWLKGHIPGGKNNLVTIRKVGHRQAFDLLHAPDATNLVPEPETASAPSPASASEPVAEPTSQSATTSVPEEPKSELTDQPKTDN